MLPLALFCLGAIIGSFLNVLVIRFGARSVSGRSECLSCATQLKWFENVPIISWLVLRGKCRSCGSAISPQYLLVELLTAVVFVAIGIGYSGASIETLNEFSVLALMLALSSIAIAIAVYDARHTIIPDAWAYAAAAIAFLIMISVNVSLSWTTVLAGPVIAFPLFALWLFSRGAWMGLGDAKLALSIGWVLGPLYGYVALMLSFMIGAFVSICILMPLPHILKYLRRKGIARLSAGSETYTMKSEVAFGPFLVAAFFITWIALLYRIPLPL